MGATPREVSFVMPPGARVLHVGPHKTGTTSLQASLHASRDAMRPQGVEYAGDQRQPLDAVLSLLARENRKSPALAPDSDKPWRDLVTQIRRSDAERIVLSSEFLADARRSAMEAVVNDLDPSRLQVMVTLRPLAKILASQWQQYVQSGLTTPYDEWLHHMLERPKGEVTPGFWWRHRHDRLIARWAKLVGPDRVTVVVVDDNDHAQLLRDMEGLLGLEPQTLLHFVTLRNRSLTLSEVEVVRSFNEQFAAAGLGKELYRQVMRFGAARYLQTRVPDHAENRLTTPRWALERAGAIGEEMAVSIAARGVRVIGDLGTLGVVPDGGRADDDPLVVDVSPDLAAAVAMGTFYASGLLSLHDDKVGELSVLGMRPLPTRLLIRTTLRRVRKRLGRARDRALRALRLKAPDEPTARPPGTAG